MRCLAFCLSIPVSPRHDPNESAGRDVAIRVGLGRNSGEIEFCRHRRRHRHTDWGLVVTAVSSNGPLPISLLASSAALMSVYSVQSGRVRSVRT